MCVHVWANKNTVDREIFAVKKFSPVAKAAKIKRSENFLCEKKLRENFTIYGIMQCHKTAILSVSS